MSVHTGGRRVRRQITLPPDVDARLRQLASQLGESQSEVVADAIRALPAPDAQLARMQAFCGILDGKDSLAWGRDIDDVLYGR